MELDQNQLNNALSLLGRILEREKSESFHIVVCGGSSLIITGLISRTTKDVDVVALYSSGGILQYANPLPERLLRAAFQVADNLGLDRNWLNNGPKDLLRAGLPDGLVDRLYTKYFGKQLTVSFIDRFDQIHLKVYAAVDGGPGRHVDDLVALKPTQEEMKLASLWAMKQDPSKEFKSTLIDMLKALRYEILAETL